ncbi:MAG TPA: UDP-N-acetylmuramoyl-L-alanine--D-glutamate ligase [Candidatus Cybelea sp.]|nr:UDP-N-acetylmuramoyl-L-alanine--D-glutamate ligase [Candidatus Cybelea sp.]
MIPVPQFKNRTVAVFGLARSGLAAIKALAAGGARVRAWDDAAMRRETVRGAELVDLAKADWRGTAALVLSPGVPLTHPKPHPVVTSAKSARVPVIGDVELFAGAGLQAKRIGITGTNGKSTTTALVGHLLRVAGRTVEVGGNIGRPILDLAPLGPDGAYVIEMSSYQIDLAPSLVCDVAVLLNITPDHLDRHGSMAGYVAVKRRIFAGQHENQTAVIGVDDADCARIYDALRLEGRRKVVPIAIGRHIANGICVVDGQLREDGEAEPVIDLARCAGLPGAHNWQNAAAAFAVARALGVARADIVRGLTSFPGLAHRMERVGTRHGVLFVNDSKATNADAAAKALACYDAIYWIAGGKAKEGGIAALEAFYPRIRHAYLIGEAAEDFARTLKGKVAADKVGTLDRAVAAAHAQALADRMPNAVVLLSPACASFDQFTDFEARGEAFRALVAALPERAA